MYAAALTPITHGPCIWCANYSAGRTRKVMTSNLLPLIIDTLNISQGQYITSEGWDIQSVHIPHALH